MSDYRVTQDATRIRYPEPKLYLDKHGTLYPMPTTRAELIRHLNLQRRIVSHLVDVIQYAQRGWEVSR
jgi:hypothetical protein